MANTEPQITKNLNFLQNISFQFFVKRLPTVNFFIQKATVPGVELGVVEYKNPFGNIPIPGEHMDWNEFEIVFKLDEDADGYISLFNWLTALGRPDDGDNYKILENISEHPNQFNNNLGLNSDLTLLVNNSKRNVNIEFTFEDAFPVALSDIDFDTMQEDLEYIPIAVRFSYRRFNVRKVP